MTQRSENKHNSQKLTTLTPRFTSMNSFKKIEMSLVHTTLKAMPDK